MDFDSFAADDLRFLSRKIELRERAEICAFVAVILTQKDCSVASGKSFWLIGRAPVSSWTKPTYPFRVQRD